MNRKKLVALVMVLALAFTTLIGGTLAYFTDTDNATNTFTMGGVDIEQYEKDRNGNEFVQNQTLLPIVNDKKDENGYHMGGNYIDKIVTVKNTGKSPAYIRTHIAVPAALDNADPDFDASLNVLHWNGASASDTKGFANWGGTLENDWYWTDYDKDGFTTDWPDDEHPWNHYYVYIDGVKYCVYVATHKAEVAPGAVTAPNLMGVYLDAKVDCKLNSDGTYTYYFMENGKEVVVDLSVTDVLVVSEAVQSEGFTDLNENGSAADEALNKAFGELGKYCPFAGGSIEEPQA